ncbi:hypothetical protein QOT17_016681 [Balamuthia mandrillaris]
MARSCNDDFGWRNHHGPGDAFTESVSWTFLNSSSASPLHIYNDDPMLLPPYSANSEEKLGEVRDRLAEVKACAEDLTVLHQGRSRHKGATTLDPDARGGFPWDYALHGYNTSLHSTTPLDSELTHFRSVKRQRTTGTPNHRIKTKRNPAGERLARRHCRSNASPARHHQQKEMAVGFLFLKFPLGILRSQIIWDNYSNLVGVHLLLSVEPRVVDGGVTCEHVLRPALILTMVQKWTTADLSGNNDLRASGNRKHFIEELTPVASNQSTHPAIMAFFAGQHFLVPMGEPEAFPFCYADVPQNCDPIQLKHWEEPVLPQELESWFTCPSQAVPFFDAELEAMLDELVCSSGREENLLYEEEKDVEERVADDLEAVLDDLLRVTSGCGAPPLTEVDPISAVSQRPVISNHPAFDISALGSGFRYLKPVKRRPSGKRKQRQSKRKLKKSSGKKTEHRPNKRSHVMEDSV